MKKGYSISITLLSTVILLASSSCDNRIDQDPEVKAALLDLDRIMLRQEEIAMAKEARIDSLRSNIGKAGDIRSMYAACDILFDEYYKWDADSAFIYAHKKDEIATLSGSQDLVNDAAIDLADRFFLSGMYHDSIDELEQVETESVADAGRLPEYYYLWYEIYHGLLQETKDEVLCRDYRKQEAKYFKLCEETATEECLEYYNTKANRLISEGRYKEVISLMQDKLSDESLPLTSRAMLRYWTAKAYMAGGDDRNALLNFTKGAEVDYSLAFKAYGSPIQVTRICFRMGDIKRAYRYIMRNYIDALQVDSRYRVNQVAEILPLITNEYENLASSRSRKLIVAVVTLILLLVALVVVLFFLREGHMRLLKANSDIIRHSQRMQESNSIKDAFLGQFLSMFSEHIDSLERYRSELRVTAKQMDFGTIQQKLRSDEFIDSEWEYLYDKFDKTFLGLFPEFVQQLNSLLEPDKRIAGRTADGKLTNEMRIFALIRLGVTDSDRIARFLRLSLSTVYNYRVKLRNAATGDRNIFEASVMRIGAL